MAEPERVRAMKGCRLEKFKTWDFSNGMEISAKRRDLQVFTPAGVGGQKDFSLSENMLNSLAPDSKAI
jgi:hypothetical protein